MACKKEEEEMRHSHNVSLILPEGMNLDEFVGAINKALNNSIESAKMYDYTNYKPLDQALNEYNLDLIAGRDIAIELKKRDDNG